MRGCGISSVDYRREIGQLRIVVSGVPHGLWAHFAECQPDRRMLSPSALANRHVRRKLQRWLTSWVDSWTLSYLVRISGEVCHLYSYVFVLHFAG